MVRLNAVHRALSSAHLDEQTVSSIAINNGFTHFGRFSVAYKQHFGESARETLRRRKN
jgi:transcriptional regulator GlxA family with amidase domain